MAVNRPSPGSVQVQDLRCEYQENPLGIDVARPHLSWTLASDQRGAAQSAYQIRVTDAGAVLWDTGNVPSRQSMQGPHGGAPNSALVSAAPAGCASGATTTSHHIIIEYLESLGSSTHDRSSGSTGSCVVPICILMHPPRVPTPRRGSDVAVTTVKRAVVRQRETGSVERKPIPGRPPAIRRDQEAILRARLEAAPDATVLKHCAW